ncbi:MAG TPA: hypothetical protein VMG10_19835 [Gemmataceae bacterium]|nr:hypothetical protein [Gemmataceae bacterium]
MGMEQTVSFAAKSIPAYPAVRDFLAQRGFPLQMGMIDGQLAFPDELPPDSWREVRLRTPQGMVTVRRDGERLVFVTWGNADAAMLQAWNALVWAFAEVGGGRVETPEGALDARTYQERVELPVGMRSES